jgi:hypothetical protein
MKKIGIYFKIYLFTGHATRRERSQIHHQKNGISQLEVQEQQQQQQQQLQHLQIKIYFQSK